MGIAAIVATLLVQACAGAAGGRGRETEAAAGSVWEGLLRPRPEPLPGAVRVAVSDLHLLGAGRWPAVEAGVPPGVGPQELVAAGLLRRRDVHFVERRRFVRAADRERRGAARPEGAPPVGRSSDAELVLTGSWVPMGPEGARLDLRLIREETGEILPARDDPLDRGTADPAPRAYADAEVPVEAVGAFLEGIAAEDAYRWEGARRSYARALRTGGEGFFEPDVALARAARLRAGGTLGASP